jgi:3-oxoisoapionate kinase
MMTNKHNLLLAYYGDDFTGSTDALEFLSRSGIKTVLFIDTPTPEQLSRYEGLQAIGVAGMTRAMPPAEMEKVLVPAFTALKQLSTPHVHYKVCSTFDSSPTTGSIGRAAKVGNWIFESPFTPLLVAAPALGRYCVFGNLFARMGIGSEGEIFRLDRHPSMSKHPVTPADESDLRLHLAKQTRQKIGLIDILTIASDEQQLNEKLQAHVNGGVEIILFDALREDDLLPIGKLMNRYAKPDRPLFSIGSSGIEMALGKHWAQTGIAQAKTDWPHPGKAKVILVLSGSCSPITSGQIAWGLRNGFAEIAIDTAAVAETDNSTELSETYALQAAELIQQGTSVIIHTSLGNHDQRIKAANEILSRKGIADQTARIYGTALGAIAKLVTQQTSLTRILIAGGDTSSFAARAMSIEAVEMIAPISPGAPLCKAYAPGSPIDGLEVNFKGGQVGAHNYFEMVLNGQNITA